MRIKYRPEIDGLRAIAVLAVIFFHTNIPGFSGGFVGVDIFFVISGFLITSIILKDIQEEKFSVAKFYERRIRRIFPALFPVLAFTLFLGAYLFDEQPFIDLGKTISATTLFSSNILFWHQAGYFATPSLQKPLLHTWSLAVEEQFYIFFPLALVFIHKYLKSQYLPVILIGLIISLVSSIFGVYHFAEATFYLVPTRAWELLVGSVLALNLLPYPSHVWMRNLLSITGIALIIYSVGFYTEAMLFPGHNAIVPVLGAGAIIYSSKGEGTTIVNKLLSVRPLVFIGLISYSLYLWHWPFVAFAKYLMFRPFNWSESASIILASLAVSTLSWKYIEQPFRGTQMLLPERTRLFAVSGAVMIIAVSVGGVIYLLGGVPGRIDWLYPNIKASTSKTNFGWNKEDEFKKMLDRNNIAFVIPPVIGNSNSTPQFILWGDSHAYALKDGIAFIAKKHNVSGFLANYARCAPILDVDRMDTPENESIVNQKILTLIKSHPSIRTVILSARWAWYFNGCGYKEEGGAFQLKGVDGITGRSNYEQLHMGLTRTVHALLDMGCRVVLVSDVPEIGYDVPRLYSIHTRFHIPLNDASPTVAEYNKRQHEAQVVLNELAHLPGVTLIHPESRMFDDNGRARIMFNGELLYWDHSHLSTYGAHYVAPVFDEVFKEISAKASRPENSGLFTAKTKQ
jgi:peptidoglycan/LPS O-acetylase OafA/YrhL